MPMMPYDFILENWTEMMSENKKWTDDELILKRMEILISLPEERRKQNDRAMRQSELMKKRYDLRNRHKLRPVSERLQIGDIVTVLDKAKRSKEGGKLRDRRMGPYQILEKIGDMTFRLAELSGIPLKYPVHGNRLMLFYYWGSRDLEEIASLPVEEDPGDDVESVDEDFDNIDADDPDFSISGVRDARSLFSVKKIELLDRFSYWNDLGNAESELRQFKNFGEDLHSRRLLAGDTSGIGKTKFEIESDSFCVEKELFREKKPDLRATISPAVSY
jgi:hypothetical protein